jgi:PAS domain S-box-containing protein
MDQLDIRDPEALLESARLNMKSLREIVFGFGEAQTIIRSMSGTIRYWSRGAERLYGWTSNEAIGRSATQLLQTVDITPPDEVARCLRQNGAWHGELIHRHRNGAAIHVASDWILQSNDGVENVVEISNDITGRVQDDATRRLYAAIVADSEDAIIGKTLDGTITSWNSAAEVMFGWKADEIIGQSIMLIIPPGKESEEHTIVAQLRAGMRVEHFETVRRHRDGREVQISLTVSPIRSASGDIVGASKIVRDIGPQRQSALALQRAQRMESIAQLTGGVAHDFNNLLGVIIASADVLRPSVAHDPVLAGIVDDILAAAVGGGRLTKRLIGFARQRHAPLEPIDLGAYLSTYTELLRRTLGGAIVITTEFAAGLWLARADASQIGDALINLALNARDAMPETGGWLLIKVTNASMPHHRLHPGDFVVLSVTDDGAGMPPEVQARALEPFFTTKPENIGNGLGLSMVAGTMARHGGRVEIETAPGAGTTVRLFLPRASTDDITTTTSVATETEPEMVGGTETILVVDDNEQLRRTVIRTLSSLGYRTVQACNGADAILMLDQGQECDLLLTDIIMPGGLTGSQLVARARELRPGLRCLLTTGFARLSDLPADGTDVAILNKPYRRHTLASAVRAALDTPKVG